MIEIHCTELRMSNVTEKPQTYRFPHKTNILFGYCCKLIVACMRLGDTLFIRVKYLGTTPVRDHVGTGPFQKSR